MGRELFWRGLDRAAFDAVICRARRDRPGPNLRSVEMVNRAVNWDIRYLIVATRNWWFGKHVLLSPYAVVKVGWSDGEVYLNVTRDQVKSSPPWDPMKAIERIEEEQLHRHYGWRGYGW